MATSAVEGVGPISVTEGGVQHLIPLSALQVDAGKVTVLDPLGVYGSSAADWAQYLWDHGRLWAPISPPPTPAMVFDAVQVGTDGSDIKVTITVPDAGTYPLRGGTNASTATRASVVVTAARL